MYCPVCGAESTQGLNYCKRCGSNLAPPTNPIRSSENRPRVRAAAGTAWAMALATVAVTLGGLGIVFSNALYLVRPINPGTTGVSGAATIAGLMVMFGSATVFGTVALLIRLFSKLLGLGQQSHDSPLVHKQQNTGEHKPVQLPAPPSVIPSVTEQTTRNFDPALYRDRES
ncbi:MAG TPA: hypothetical protein VGV87_07580 [Blastocatellia bacterium]|nr:hypothetical protein [Blastocatellia bacterium]